MNDGGFRNREVRNVVFSGAAQSNEIEISPGAAYSLYLDSDLSGATVSLEVEASIGLDSSGDHIFITVVDPDSELPFTANRSQLTILPTAIYSSAAGIIRLR